MKFRVLLLWYVWIVHYFHLGFGCIFYAVSISAYHCAVSSMSHKLHPVHGILYITSFSLPLQNVANFLINEDCTPMPSHTFPILSRRVSSAFSQFRFELQSNIWPYGTHCVTLPMSFCQQTSSSVLLEHFHFFVEHDSQTSIVSKDHLCMLAWLSHVC